MITPPLSANVFLHLHQAIELWQDMGAQWVELPWLAALSCTEATRPPNRKDIATPFGVLVASGEQSFLSLLPTTNWERDQLYIGCTPCFRHEEVFDATHHYYFLKAEVFVPTSPLSASNQLLRVRDAAYDVFDQMRLGNSVLEIQPTAEGFDIVCNGLEIGSYGQRVHDGQTYVYGTALAEPRWSQAQALL